MESESESISETTSGDSGHPIEEYISKRRTEEQTRTKPTCLIDSDDDDDDDDDDADDSARQRTPEHVHDTKKSRGQDSDTKDSLGPDARAAFVELLLPPPLQPLDTRPFEGQQAVKGVVIVSDDEDLERQSAEMWRLLRHPRYFDEDFDAGVTCFKCGGTGHVAKDCPNPEKLRPCFLCAQFGHTSRNCPNSVCYRCGSKDHQVRDCTGVLDRWDSKVKHLCRKCGREDCRAAHEMDTFRAEGECVSTYIAEDLNMVECFSCGRVGHVNCKDLADTAPKPSCYNCGEGGHIGIDCTREPTLPVRSERRRAYNLVNTSSKHMHYNKYDRQDGSFGGQWKNGFGQQGSRGPSNSSVWSSKGRERRSHNSGIDLWGSSNASSRHRRDERYSTRNRKVRHQSHFREGHEFDSGKKGEKSHQRKNKKSRHT